MKKTLMRHCINIAKEFISCHEERFLHYSFIIQNNQLVEWATNKTAQPPIGAGYPSYSKIHSEFLAYKRAKGLLDKKRGWVIFNIRFNKFGEFRNSKPCPCCERFLKELGCKSATYTTPIGIEKKYFDI